MKLIKFKFNFNERKAVRIVVFGNEGGVDPDGAARLVGRARRVYHFDAD